MKKALKWLFLGFKLFSMNLYNYFNFFFIEEQQSLFLLGRLDYMGQTMLIHPYMYRFSYMVFIFFFFSQAPTNRPYIRYRNCNEKNINLKISTGVM